MSVSVTISYVQSGRRVLLDNSFDYDQFKFNNNFNNGINDLNTVFKAPEDEEETAKEVTSSTIRIRNLEDLFKQIQEHTVRHSPSGSEENRMSETEVDRHYRHDSHPG